MTLLHLLQIYRPTPEEEKGYLQMIEFVQKYPDCFERTLGIGHITGSAWLLSKDGSQVLLTHHAKLDLWCQFGGHCDGDPDVLKTAIREAQEESGIIAIEPLSNEIFDIDIHPIPAWGKEKAHFHYDVRFLLQVKSDEQFLITPESKKLQWFGKNPKELPSQERSLLRMHEKWCLIY